MNLRRIPELVNSLLDHVVALSVMLVGVPLAMLSRFIRHSKPRLVWGPTPIINNKYWSIAMQQRGFSSKTLMRGVYTTINRREDFDEILPGKRKVLAFKLFESLLKYDVFFISFDGWLLGNSRFWRFEGFLLRLAGKKIVVIPYGSDALVYKFVRSPTLLHGLMMSYPLLSQRQDQIEAKVKYWVRNAHCLLPGAMAGEGLGRWDVLSPSILHIDAASWSLSLRESDADGSSNTVYIAHAPNHRGVKGSEFLVDAIKTLQKEGLKVELILLEKMPNELVRHTLMHKVDILVEQLILGYALNAIEGMACGLPVVSNLDEMEMALAYRRWSFLEECPIASATPEDIVGVLRTLIIRPALRRELGHAGRRYVEKYHSLEAAGFLFSEVLEYVYARRSSLTQLYHPLLSDRSEQAPKVAHPLVNNRVVD